MISLYSKIFVPVAHGFVHSTNIYGVPIMGGRLSVNKTKIPFLWGAEIPVGGDRQYAVGL